ncbi:MAG: hypothetical protein NTV33_09680 [Coprothermobacterota bacterium]|nr:hypothetical protein [Coprothermobacterota bacterium]
MRRRKGTYWVKAAIMIVCSLTLVWLGPAGIVGQEQERAPRQASTPLSSSASSVSSLSAAGELAAGGQWAPLPLYGEIMSLAIDPSNALALYAGTRGNGVYKSSDGGASWAASSSGLPSGASPNGDARCLVIVPSNPQTLYVGTYSGVFKSANGGTNWAASSSGLTNTNVWCLAIDPSNPQTLYAGTYGIGGGVFKSSNGGTSWALSSTGLAYSGLAYSDVPCLAINPITPQILYAGTYGGWLFKSANGGANWASSSTGLTSSRVMCLALDPSTPQTLYAGTDGVGACKSANGGANWAASSTGLTNNFIQCLAIDPSTPQNIYAGTWEGGVCKSANGGANWTAFSSGLTSLNVQALAIDPSNPQILYAGANGGVFKYTPPTITLTYNLSAGWNMISVPLVLPDPLSKWYIPEGWPIYSWDAANARYSSLRYIPLLVGVGYWLKAPFAQPLTITGPPYTGDTIAISLSHGWNMIGTPYTQPVSYSNKVVAKNGSDVRTLDQAVTAGWIQAPLYRWTGSAYEGLTSSGSFQPLAGYWVKVLLRSGCSMIFTKP